MHLCVCDSQVRSSFDAGTPPYEKQETAGVVSFLCYSTTTRHACLTCFFVPGLGWRELRPEKVVHVELIPPLLAGQSWFDEGVGGRTKRVETMKIASVFPSPGGGIGIPISPTRRGNVGGTDMLRAPLREERRSANAKYWFANV